MTSDGEGHLSPAAQSSDGPLHDVVVFGTYDTSLHPRVEVLCEGLSESADVTRINHRLGMSTADKIDAASSIGGMVRLLVAIAKAWVPLWRQARRYGRDPDLVVVGYLGHFDVHLARALWPDSRIALDHLVGLADTARDRGLASGLKYRLLDVLDRAALRRADIVVVDTEEQLEQLPELVRPRSIVVPVGAARVWAEQAGPPEAPPLRVCFVGLYTPLHGAPVIGEAIAMLADDDRIEFTMVGSGQDRAATELAAGSSTHVRWIDWLPSDELPELVASQHVCLGIFGTTPKALRVVPTKVYQGVAAGNLVVTSDTAPQRRVLDGAARFVPPGDPVALADALRSIAGDADRASFVGTGADPTEFRPGRVVEALVGRRVAMTDVHSLSDGPALPPNAWLRFDVLRPHLEGLPRGRVLEIGPGRGAIAARMVSAGHDYTGVEMSEEAREATASLLDEIPGGPRRLVAGLADLDPAERFDLVYAFEVLEHIEEDREALEQWAERLEPGGQILISVPAWGERFSAHDLEVGHIRRYDPEQLRALAAGVGLVDIEVTLYGAPLGFLLEFVRNRIAVRLQQSTPVAEESAIDRTKRSGGWLQPPRSLNRVIEMGTWPFRVVQRRVPSRGTGLVLSARSPSRR